MKIRALFVDLGGVLIINRVREIGEKYNSLYGLSPEVSSKIFRYIQTDSRTKEEINSILQKENIELNVWNNFVKEFYSSENRNERLVELLDQVKTRGIKILFTTNNSDAVMNIISKYKIDNLADYIVNSSEKKVAKPDKEFWEVAFYEATKLIPDLKKGEVLVIDDSGVNCDSATSFGFNAHKYLNHSSDQTEIARVVNL